MNKDPNQPYNFDYFFAKNLEETGNSSETESDEDNNH
jgi:hypothetical protein